MLRSLGIRGKFLAALSVPVLVLFALAGTISMQAVEDVRVARTVNELLGALGTARQLTAVLQAERDATMQLVMSDATTAEGLRGEVESSRAAVNQAIGAARQAASSIDLASLDPVVQRAVTGLDDQLGALENLRSTVDAGGVTVRYVFNGYSTVVERVTAFPSVVANALDDRRLATIINAQTQTMQLVEDYRQEQVLGRAVLDGARSNADVQELLRTIPASNVQQESTTLTVAQLELGEEVVVPPVRIGLQSYGNIRSIPLGGESTFLTFITSEQWYALAGEQAGEYDQLLNQLRVAAQDRADAVENGALRTAILTVVLTVLAVVVSIATAFAVARQIVEPLRRLTLAAGQVRDELPRLVEQVSVPGRGPDLALARIPVTSRDEVGRLAEAFNEVNATTIQVAQEQAALRGSIAEMFVNVARRDQVLLNRQLSFIDALERSEEDPATLADLFRLDHLATRMRRNAESLLVLAGIDTGRRLREPLPVSDVIRTASSEIEHYERIQLDLQVDPSMLGHVALPAAHLLAELLENATVFSDPGSPVHVSTGIDATHVIVTVLDQGLGMTAAELAEANAKIRTTSASDVVGAQRLGLFVVGRIAGRLGADVQLSLGPDGTGTLATVRIPVVLFLETEAIPFTAPVTAGARRAETFAPVEAAATAAHDSAFAPAPAHAQDVRAGSVGSPENPAAEVDLGALTDGQTGHGLPRRRQRGAEAAPLTTYRDQDDAAAAPSIPLAPRADALAGAAGVPVEGGWAPDVVEAQPLAVRRRADDDAPEAPLPSRAPAAADTTSVLPTRTPATPDLPVRASALRVRESALPVRESGLPVRDPAGASRAGDGPSEVTAPAAPPESRTSMFSGFRSRRAELAAAAVDQLPDREDEQPAGDGADRLAAAATGFGGGWGEGGDAPAEPVPLVIPALEDDDVPPSLLGAVEERPSGRHALRVEEPAWQPVEPEPVEPAWSAQAFEVPALEVSDDDAWSPSPAAADDELWAPQVEASEGAPGEHVPSEQWQVPTWEEDPAPTASWPSPEQPVAVEQPAAEQWDDDAAWSAPTTPALAEVEPVWAPQPTAEAEPVWAPQPTAEVEPAWAPQPTAEVEPAWAPQPTVAAEPAPPVPATPWSRVGEPAAGPVGLPGAPDDAVVAVEPTSKRRWWSFGRGARSHAPAAVGTPAAPVVEAVAAPSWSADPVVEPAPAAPTAPVRASAWGSPEAGAHARTPVEPVAPATPGSGAAAFFPSVHATRDAQGVAGAPSAVEPVAEPQVEHGWQVPSPRPAPPQPAAPAAPATGAWAPQSWDGPEVPQWGQAASTGQGAGAGAPAAAEAPPTAVSPEPAPTTFTPEPASFDAEVNTMLAQRADLAQQALAELSQLSAYRPQAVTGGTGSLTRRTPTAVPAAPEIATASGGPRPERDANQVRSLLSSFQSGTSRGRMAVDGAQTTGTGSPGAGHEEGPSGAEGEPVAAVVPTDSDLTQRGTSW